MEAPGIALWLLFGLVALALAHAFLNGFHDAANSIATVVSTGVLRPQQAVLFAAFFNVAAYAVFELHVAETIGKGLVDPAVVDHHVVVGALAGAIGWSLLARRHGIPSSSSHALIGGILGGALAKAGWTPLLWSGLGKTLAFIVVAPLLGFALGSALIVLISRLFRRSSPRRVDGWFRRLQLVSAGLYSLGHGGNDAQKTIGLIWLMLIAAGSSTAAERAPPDWVVVGCYLAIGLGTMFGGWRVVRTMRQRITKLKPVHGFSADSGGAITLFLVTSMGIPVSTTHTITGAIVGVGSTRRASAVRWGVARSIVWAWALTIPGSALLAALGYGLSRLVL